MSLQNAEELESVVQDLMGATSAKISSDGYTQAINLALAELHWSFPLDHSVKEYWLIQRTKRYVLDVLLTEAAWKFQYKQIYLQHRFNQLFKMIQKLDNDFISAIDNNPMLFDTDTYGNLFDYLSAGFSYSKFGYDTTYDSDNYLNGDTYLY